MRAIGRAVLSSGDGVEWWEIEDMWSTVLQDKGTIRRHLRRLSRLNMNFFPIN